MKIVNSTASRLLAKSIAQKATFLKMKTGLVKLNEEMLAESAKINDKISELQESTKLLADESKENSSVIKNIDKILGI